MGKVCSEQTPLKCIWISTEPYAQKLKLLLNIQIQVKCPQREKEITDC